MADPQIPEETAADQFKPSISMPTIDNVLEIAPELKERYVSLGGESLKRLREQQDSEKLEKELIVDGQKVAVKNMTDEQMASVFLSKDIKFAWQVFTSDDFKTLYESVRNLYISYGNFLDVFASEGLTQRVASWLPNLSNPIQTDFESDKAQQAKQKQEKGETLSRLEEAYLSLYNNLENFKHTAIGLIGTSESIEYNNQIFGPNKENIMAVRMKVDKPVLFIHNEGEVKDEVMQYIHEVVAWYYITNGFEDIPKDNSERSERKRKLSETPYLVLEALFEDPRNFRVS